MPLSWNEIRARAVTFSKDWDAAISEDADAKTFWDEFFNVFGITRRRIASFEEPVKKRDGHDGYIDLLWKGTLLVEHKSRGKDLDRALGQAFDYFQGLKERDLPRYVVVSDFARFRLYDLDEDKVQEFELKDLQRNVRHFGFIAGYETQRIEEREESANIKAAEQLGKLHDQLKAAGYTGHPLELLLVRLLFCLFADDTGIFEKNQFRDYLDKRTSEDGADLGMHLAQLFEVLNCSIGRRQKTLDEQLAEFTYVNGRLFDEHLPTPAFSSAMRETLLDASRMDWGSISPAIFGSLFQSIMDEKARRNLGAHYTRELNILKALKPLFLDDLHAEFESLKRSPKRLLEFQHKLAGIKILDPACGCGNFLVIAYRELRLLELQVLHELYVTGESSKALDVKSLVFVDVDQFYGIEIEEFPAQIAQVAIWLTDHQMNQRVSDEFGQYFARLPLVKSPNIVNGNALRIAWEDVVKPEELSYIVGNPPFGGKHYQGRQQKAEVLETFSGLRSASDLDYVAAWYKKAVDYMAVNPRVLSALVSTNSIVQGEQAALLWPFLFARGLRINFAHRTFRWTSEARGGASVHCVIVGFALRDVYPKRLFDYDNAAGEAHENIVGNIGPYLIDGPDIVITKRRDPLSGVPPMRYGNKPSDDSNYILDEGGYAELLAKEPGAKRFLRRYLGSDDFINGVRRWCLWLKDADPAEIRALPEISRRVDRVRAFRLASSAEPTRRAADTPTLFFYISQPSQRYLVVPEVSSERRSFIPIGFVDAATICSNTNYLVPEGSLYLFGVLSSTMHMAWVRTVGGRLESRYRYSGSLVYNTFPWPEVSDKQREAIESAAQRVLDARTAHPNATLADLYDPISMPPDLVRAHQTLDKVVDAAYGKKGFKTEAERVAFLFELYQKITAPLDVAPAPRRAKKKAKKRATGR